MLRHFVFRYRPNQAHHHSAATPMEIGQTNQPEISLSVAMIVNKSPTTFGGEGQQMSNPDSDPYRMKTDNPVTLEPVLEIQVATASVEQRLELARIYFRWAKQLYRSAGILRARAGGVAREGRPAWRFRPSRR